ncbi:MAG TPA: RluA family pseudouridine synthase [Methylomirabilota bacterium]|nr:RluA family pseudouridine synthase [Methylomirabilota bacterium]
MQRVTTVSAGQSPRRLDVFVSTQTAHLSRAVVQRWIDGGLITVNGRQTKAARLIRPGDVITCHVPVREPPPVEPEPLALRVLHEDAAILVVDKPAGLVMHPGPGHWTGTLLNALVHHVGVEAGEPDDGRRARPGLVHRLDKGTSGVLVIAKTDAAHRDLSRQFRAHSVRRVYLALVAGAVRRGGLIERALGRDTRDRRRISTRAPAARRAVTEYRVAERLGPDATLVEARPRTGRMHQIRVHLASIGHALLGDASYGAADPELSRPMLHAAVLGFAHPATGAYAEFRAPLPADMEDAVARRRAAAQSPDATRERPTGPRPRSGPGP